MQTHLLAGVVAIFVSVFIAYPVLVYLRSGWETKRKDILLALSPAAKILYMDLFLKEKCDESEVDDKFAKYYNGRYKKSFFVVPTLFLSLTVLVQGFLVAETGLNYVVHPADAYAVSSIAAAAFAGAFVFVALDLITRNEKRDLGSSDVLRGATRIIAAIVIGYAFSGLFKDDLATFVAFGVGVFPLGRLEAFTNKILIKKFEINETTSTGSDITVKLSIRI
jgi:hypothetical protein